MKTLKIYLSELGHHKWHEVLLLQFVLILLWFSAPRWLYAIDPHAALADSGLWLLIIMAIITFILFVILCGYLLNACWVFMGLPAFSLMVLQFENLTLWQRFAFYWASFALLLLTAAVTLIAIC